MILLITKFVIKFIVYLLLLLLPSYSKKVNIPIIGVVENMTNSVFDSLINSNNGRAAIEMCKNLQVPYGGRVPMDQSLMAACEMGKSLIDVNPDSEALIQINSVIDEVILKKLSLISN